MIETTQELNLNQIANLLSRYGFDLRGYRPEELIEQWQPLYPILWIRLAVVEALYQGRYKVISVEHILDLWLRRGQPTFHFNLEFERLICHNLLRETRAELQADPWTPTQGSGEMASETPESLASVAAADDTYPLEAPRLALSNLEDLFSQFVPPEPAAPEGQKVSSSQATSPWTSPRVAIDQFTPLLDRSGLYFRLKAAIQKS